MTNNNISAAMNSLVFELHTARVAGMLRVQEMWNANSSLAEFCLCSRTLIRCLFSLLTQQLALRSGSESASACVCV